MQNMSQETANVQTHHMEEVTEPIKKVHSPGVLIH